MTSAFDPQMFLDAQQAETNEKRPNLPVENPDDPNGFYTGVIGEVKMAAGTIGKGDRIGQAWMQAVVPIKLQVPAALQALGIPAELTLTDRPMIDLTPGSVFVAGQIQGGIDNAIGKNNAQRKYREATHLNVKGEPFAWRQTQGKVIKVKITHEEYQGSIVEKIAGVFPS